MDRVGSKQDDTGRVTSPQELDLALELLLYRTWFHRARALQEAIVAKRAVFIIGDKSIDFSLLSMEELAKHGLRPVMKNEVVPGIYRWMTHQLLKGDMLFALHLGRNFRASDPRDKVFALFVLFEDHLDASLNPDYGLTVAEVFTQTAAYLIQSQNTLAVLSYVSNYPGPDCTSIGLPYEWKSWRPSLDMGTSSAVS
jgi:hypothetical protein